MMKSNYVVEASHRAPSRLRPGFAMILAMTFLTVFASLGVVIVHVTTLSAQKAHNFRLGADARLAGESGLSFMLHCLKDVRLPADTVDATFPENLRAALAGELNGTANLDGQSVALVDADTTVFVPEVKLEGGKTFCCWIESMGENRCRLKVKGSVEGISRYLTMELTLANTLPLVFEYGLASRGRINISGHTTILGVNDPEEANVFSATDSHTEAIYIEGSNVKISGDLFASGETSIEIAGSPNIGGTADPVGVLEHLHTGQEAPDFPEVDVAPLAALATNVVDDTTDTSSSGGVFNNIRIAAGTNPTFASDVVINGVVYVEAPNIVRFEGQSTINGFIVTQDSDEPIEDCQLIFAGTLNSEGAGTLPDTEEFSAVRQHTGTFLLAPGFGAHFAGNFQTINGSIAADQLTFSGTAEGRINGVVIGLADLPTVMDGNVSISVDRSTLDPNPAGFGKPFVFVSDVDSYMELQRP